MIAKQKFLNHESCTYHWRSSETPSTFRASCGIQMKIDLLRKTQVISEIMIWCQGAGSHDSPSVQVRYFKVMSIADKGPSFLTIHVTCMETGRTHTKQNNEYYSTCFLVTLRHNEHLCGFLPLLKYTTKLTSDFLNPSSPFLCLTSKSPGLIAAEETGYFLFLFFGFAPERQRGEKSVGFPSVFIWPSLLSGSWGVTYVCFWRICVCISLYATALSAIAWEYDIGERQLFPLGYIVNILY